MFQIKISQVVRRFRTGFIIMLLGVSPFILANEQEDLIIEFLTMSKNFSEIQPVIKLIQKTSIVYNCFPSISPIRKHHCITSLFGYRFDPVSDRKQFHKGIDMKSDYAVAIYATASGKVKFAGSRSGYGRCIIIEHDYGFVTLYAHLSGFYCKKGDYLNKGQIIGFLGSSGRSTGAHLHYEVVKNGVNDDPQNYIL